MTIESAGLQQIRGPFDYCVTEKSALLKALATDGQSLQHSPADSCIFTMPIEKREGIHSDGVYYWHDYLNADRLRVDPDWAKQTERVNEKYDFLWRRFARAIDEPSRKIFVLSSTQHNLPQFAEDDAAFARKFAIDGAFLAEVHMALAKMHVRNFSIVAMVSSFSEADMVRAHGGLDDLTIRYCGKLALSSHDVVSQLLRDSTERAGQERLGALVGTYDSGALIKREAQDAVRVFRNVDDKCVPWGEGYVSGSGYIFAFADERSFVVKAEMHDGRLCFSDRSAWVMVRPRRSIGAFPRVD